MLQNLKKFFNFNDKKKKLDVSMLQSDSNFNSNLP